MRVTGTYTCSRTQRSVEPKIVIYYVLIFKIKNFNLWKENSQLSEKINKYSSLFQLQTYIRPYFLYMLQPKQHTVTDWTHNKYETTAIFYHTLISNEKCTTMPLISSICCSVLGNI